MFVWSIKMNRRELIITAVGLALFILLAAALLLSSGSGTAVAADGCSLCAATAQERTDFLSQYGWQTEPVPLAVREVVIPRDFDEEYQAYSELQATMGFDMEALRGERVKLWTYRVTNHPAGGDMVANLLVQDGVVVGGDISRAVDGTAAQGFDPARFGSVIADMQQTQAAAIDRSVPDAIPASSDVPPEPDGDGEW